MSKLAARFLFFLGLSLWIPGIALINVADAWGLQVAMIFGLLLATLIIVVFLTAGGSFGKLVVKKQFLTYYGVYFAVILSCTVFSRIGIAKSAQTFFSETIGTIFAATVAWWLCRSPGYSAELLRGFRIGGLVAASYGIYQVVGWHLGLPLTYIPMNNASFSILPEWAARAEGRALGITPEPSALASMLLPLLGMMTVDVIVSGGIRRYGYWIMVFLAYLSTSSQSVAIIPLFLPLVFFFVKPMLPDRRLLRRSDILGFGVLILGAAVLLLTNDSILFWLSRLTGAPSGNLSATLRSAEIYAGLQKFQQSPLFGYGLGSASTDLDLYAAQLGLPPGSLGSSSGFFRILSEEGLAGMMAIIVGVFSVFPRRMDVQATSEAATRAGYQFTFVAGTALAIFFAGYRSMYHLWLIVPVGLSLRSQWHESTRTIDPQLIPPMLDLDKIDGELIE